MTRKLTLSKIMAVSLLVLASGINSCKKPTEGLNLIITTRVSEATVSVQFVDAATGEQIGTSANPVIVEIEGEDKALITDNSGSSNIQSSNGFVTLALKKGTVPSASNPIEFHLAARATGYVKTAMSVVIDEKGTQHHIVYMVNVNNTPDGVGAVTNTALIANASGATQTALQLTTPVLNTAFENTQATVTIPAGTILLDKNNEPVTGTITSTLVYFNNQDESSLKAFPDGYSAKLGTENDVFKTGGYLSLVMKNGGGKEVKNFGSAVQSTIQVPAGSTNAQGTPVSSGLVAPIWSYDEDDGQWINESQPNIAFNGTNNKFEVTFDINHLSYWNIHWKNTNSCETGATVTVNSDVSASANAIGVLYYDNGEFFKSMNVDMKDGSSMVLKDVPSGQSMFLKIYKDQCAYATHTPLTTLTIADACSGSYTLDLTGQISNTVVSVTVNATCANRPGRIIRPTVSLYVRETGSCGTNVWQYLGEMVDGKITTAGLEQGKTYQIGTMFGDEWKVAPDTYTISETEYLIEQVLPLEICNLLE